MISLKSKRELKWIREASLVLMRVFEEVEKNVACGVTTNDLDRIAEKVILKAGAKPAFKGYRGYPKTACISVNEEVVHGIPGPRKLREGDLVSFDIGAKVDDYYADAARTWLVNPAADETRRLAETAKDSFDAGVTAYTPGCRIGDLSSAIQKCIEQRGYQVVRDYVGHGIGRGLHEEPQVPNYGEPGKGPKIEEGLVLAIEPMVTQGRHAVKTLQDGWTVVTQDGKLASHYEDTIVFFNGRVYNLTRGDMLE